MQLYQVQFQNDDISSTYINSTYDAYYLDAQIHPNTDMAMLCHTCEALLVESVVSYDIGI